MKLIKKVKIGLVSLAMTVSLLTITPYVKTEAASGLLLDSTNFVVSASGTANITDQTTDTSDAKIKEVLFDSSLTTFWQSSVLTEQTNKDNTWLQIDLGDTYNLSHVYYKGRAAGDPLYCAVGNITGEVFVSVSMTGTDWDSAETYSADSLWGTNKSAPSSAYTGGTAVNLEGIEARYIRISGTEGYHYQEGNRGTNICIAGLQIYGTPLTETTTEINLAKGILPLIAYSDGSDIEIKTDRPGYMATDGVIPASDASSNYADFASDSDGSNKKSSYLQVDLGGIYDVNKIKLWRYWNGGRTYYATVIAVSETEDFLDSYTVYNTDTNNLHGLGAGTEATYQETSAGKTWEFTAQKARYVRVYQAGSSYNNSGRNHIVELEVYGTMIEEIIPDVDKEKLGLLIDEADSEIGDNNSGNQYKAANFETYLEALTNAQSVYENDNATIEQIQQAFQDLRDAMDGLVDIEVLKENIAILEENRPTDQSAEWLEGYDAFIEQLKEVLNAEYVTQVEVDAADSRVDLAETYASLYEEVENAKETYEQGNDDLKYSVDSWNEFEASYTEALELLEKTDSIYEDFEAVVGTVTLAADQLELLEDELTQEDIIDAVAGNTHSDDQNIGNIFDGDRSTLWHTSWSGSPRSDHHFTVKVPARYYDAIELLPREQKQAGDINGIFQEIKVYVKLGEDGEWIEVAHQSELSETDWSTVNLEKHLADYIKVEVIEARSDSSTLYASLAEMKIHYDTSQLNRDGWKSVAYFSNGDIAEYQDTQAEYEINGSPNAGPAEYLFDGDITKKYHTNWANQIPSQTYYSEPITFIFKLGETETFNAVDWLNRVDSEGCRLNDFDLYTIDDDLDYTNEQLKSGAPWVQKFSITATNIQNPTFYVGEQTTKYIKLVCTSRDTAHHLACAELNFLYNEEEEGEEIKYTGMNATLSPTDWIKESAYNQNKEVKGYYGYVGDTATEESFSNEEANLVKYVDSSVLSVKAQSMVTTNNDAEVINVRFITSIASTNLENIRFKIEIVNPDGQARARYLSTNKVYRTIYADDVEISNAAQVMGNNISTYFAVCKLNNIPASLRNDAQQTRVRVTPYWAPKDVATDNYTNYVEGIAREFTISDLYQKASPTTPINE